MKITTQILVCLVIFKILMAGSNVSAAPSVTSATPTTSTDVTSVVEEPRRAHYKVQALYSSYQIQESGVASRSGTLGGFEIGGTYSLKSEPQFLAWGIEYFSGTPDYSGPTSTTGAPIVKKSDENFYTIGGAWGARSALGGVGTSVDGTIGASYRYLDNHVRDRRVVQNEQALVFVPVRLNLEQKLSQRADLHLTIENDFVVIGQNRQHFSDINPNLPVAKLTQTSGTGQRVAVGARRLMGDLDMTGELYYRSWQLPSSNTQGYVDGQGSARVAQEPATTTEMVGMALGVSY
jgi:hypothetical protein